MAIEVRIPTILRSYTGGAKTVEGSGDTLAALLSDLDGKHNGLRGRLVTERGRPAPVRQRLRQRRGRPVPRRARGQGVRRRHRDDPAGGRRRRVRLRRGRRDARPLLGGGRHGAVRQPARRVRGHAAGRPAPPVAVGARGGAAGTAVGQARGPQPDRQHQGPAGAVHGPRGRARRPAPAGRHDPRAHQRQHRHLAGDGRQAARLPAGLRDAGERLGRADPAAPDVRRGDHLLARGGRLQPGGGDGEADRRGAPRLGDALPVRQPGQRPRPLRDDRAGAAARPADDHPLRGRAGHHRHADGRRAVPAREGRGHRGRSRPSRATASWSTACATSTRGTCRSSTTLRC